MTKPNPDMIDPLRAQATFAAQQKRSREIRSATALQRVSKLKALQRWMTENATEIHMALYADLGKSAAEADISELSMVKGEISHAISRLSSWMEPKKVTTPLQMLGSSAFVRPEPKGCALIISPWNYPFNLCIGPLVSAIAAGCTAWLKPSEMAPHTAALIRRMIQEIYEPDEVTVSEGGAEASEFLLSLPFDHIFFTGSPAIGKVVMKAASIHLSSVTLELGGKSPVIIDKRCDLKDAARKVAWAKFLNCGQTCIAPDYVMVQESVYEEFKVCLQESLEAMGNPKGKGVDKSADYSRIINVKHWSRLKELLGEALGSGGRLLYGGQMNEADRFFSPTLIEGVDENAGLMTEEIFGPILPLQTYTVLEEALTKINVREKPLALYLFTTEKYIQEEVAAKTSSGALCINDCSVHFAHPSLPFGGVGQSGMGKAHGQYGFLAFSNEKAIFIQHRSFSLVKALYPPYTISTKKLIEYIMQWI
jgi:aldehyde dehydrogenase (NAD+)